MDEEINFEMESQNLLETFKNNLLKAILISELNIDSLSSSFEEDLKIEIEKIQKLTGVENIAKDQAVVMIASSFEAFMKDIFKLMIQKEDILKNALRIPKQMKIKPQDIIYVLNNKITWGEIIIKEEHLSFQNLKSLCKISNMLGFQFEDILEDSAKELNNLLKIESDNQNKLILSGEDLFKTFFETRHKIVHKSLDFKIDDFDFRNYLLFFQYLSASVRGKFFPTTLNIFSRKFTFQN
jgi:hypothetical protein